MRFRANKGKQRAPRDNRDRGRPSENIVYGVLPVLEALRAESRVVEKVLVAEGKPHQRIREITSLAKEKGIPVSFVPRAAIERAAGGEVNHQGVLAHCSSARYADADKLLERLAEAQASICLILDGIEDPHNLGAIIRTAECAGIDAIFIPDRRSSGLNETVAKTSAGAVELVDIARVTNINRLIEDLKEAGFWIAGTDGLAEVPYTDADWSGKWAIVLGGEGAGIHKLTREKCDVLVKIPLYGRIASLNVSVAAGILLFEIARQQGAKIGRAQEKI